MSFGNSYSGGRTRFQTNVIVNVYDLSPSNEILYPMGLGLYHTGVEILGTEYSFASGAGVFESVPQQAPGARFREAIPMGSYDGGHTELKRVLSELSRGQFGPEDYNLIRRNCNHFANALCWKLLGTTIPPFINRMADIGKCCSCLLPRSMLENAPVGDPNQNTGTEMSSFLVKKPHRATNAPDTASSTATSPFIGKGSRLGSSASSTASSSSSTGSATTGGTLWSSGATNLGGSKSNLDDLTDRREKVRKAALARFEKNKQEQSPK